MRIVGGKFKGRKLEAPQGRDTRPTSDRARESVFNILEHQTWGRAALRAGRVLDVFSGTGALGLEAMSRGADHVTFFDNDEAAMKVLHQNIKAMGERLNVQATRTDATNPPAAKEACSLVFMDAPYGLNLTDPTLSVLKSRGWIDDKTVCIIEVPKKEKWATPEGFEEIDRRKYGVAEIVFIKM